MYSILKPRLSHLRTYIRNNISAQSCASVPPAPACISKKQSFISASPESSASNCCFSNSIESFFRASCCSDIVSSSFSDSPISINKTISSSCVKNAFRSFIFFSSEVRSRMSAWALSGFSHKAGSAVTASNSSSLRLALSQSKMPPK